MLGLPGAAGETLEPAGMRRNAVFALLTEVTTGLFTATLTLYLARKLDPDGYGLFVVAMGIGALVMLPADLGLSQSAARFLAERMGERSAMARVYASAFGVKIAAAALFSVLLFALAAPIANVYNLPELAWPLRAMAFATFAQSVFTLPRVAFEAIGRMNSDWQLVGGESTVELTASIVIVALGGGAAGAVWGRAIGYGFGALLGILIVVRLLGSDALRFRSGPEGLVRRLVRYGFALMIIDSVWAVFSQIDVLLVGAILGAGAAGVFGAPLRLTAFLTYPASAITAGIAPRLASGDGDPDPRPLEIGLRTLIAFQSLAIAPLIVWAEPIVNLLLGPGYGESAGVMRALVPFIFLAGPTRLMTISVNYLGEARRRILYAIAALALNIVVDLILINQIGVVGGAIGNDVAFALYAFGHLHICRQLTGLPLRPLVASFARGIVAAAAMAGVLVLFGVSHVATPLLVLGLVIGTLVFAAVLIVLREPLIDELSESLPAPLARRLRRPPPSGD
jgi:O-antigen/teichoic acid export membrane protein